MKNLLKKPVKINWHTARNINFARSGSVQSCLQQYYRFSLEKSEDTII